MPAFFNAILYCPHCRLQPRVTLAHTTTLQCQLSTVTVQCPQQSQPLIPFTLTVGRPHWTRLACTRCTATWVRCQLATSTAQLPVIALQNRTRLPHHPAVAVRRAQVKLTHLMSLLMTPFQLLSHPQCIPCLIKKLISRKTTVPTNLNFSFGMCKVCPIISDLTLHF